MAKEAGKGVLAAPIEEWKDQIGTKAVVFEGVKAFMGWKPGKEVTQEAYADAVKEFCSAPMSGAGREVSRC